MMLVTVNLPPMTHLRVVAQRPAVKRFFSSALDSQDVHTSNSTPLASKAGQGSEIGTTILTCPSGKHSRTLREYDALPNLRQVLECARPSRRRGAP